MSNANSNNGLFFPPINYGRPPPPPPPPPLTEEPNNQQHTWKTWPGDCSTNYTSKGYSNGAVYPSSNSNKSNLNDTRSSMSNTGGNSSYSMNAGSNRNSSYPMNSGSSRNSSYSMNSGTSRNSSYPHRSPSTNSGASYPHHSPSTNSGASYPHHSSSTNSGASYSHRSSSTNSGASYPHHSPSTNSGASYPHHSPSTNSRVSSYSSTSSGPNSSRTLAYQSNSPSSGRHGTYTPHSNNQHSYPQNENYYNENMGYDYNPHTMRNYYNPYYSSNRGYQGTRSYFPSPSWQNNGQGYKRPMSNIGDERRGKKKLAPQTTPKRTWSAEDAARALEVEKELNRNTKNSLVIKFPDQELKREIVTKLHPSIKNVHFRNPYTPRFCFVSLETDADTEQVIRDLSKIPFGTGYLSAEVKKETKKDQDDDIDPLSLYVGNLSQDVTIDDLIAIYPNRKRADIGFAQKMKFTRYAFVSFRTVDEAIEALKGTHNTEMYNRSLIVRFNRLNGAVGVPGEQKNKRTESSGQSSQATITNGVKIKQESRTPDASDEENVSFNNYDDEDDEHKRRLRHDTHEDEEEVDRKPGINLLQQNQPIDTNPHIFTSHRPICVKKEAVCATSQIEEVMGPHDSVITKSEPIEEDDNVSPSPPRTPEQRDDEPPHYMTKEIKQENIALKEEDPFDFDDERDIDAEFSSIVAHQHRLQEIDTS